ncbi:hypothetical protein BC832DRAFT_542933, partial [Gaertneriomyces semiglobifer]
MTNEKPLTFFQTYLFNLNNDNLGRKEFKKNGVDITVTFDKQTKTILRRFEYHPDGITKCWEIHESMNLIPVVKTKKRKSTDIEETPISSSSPSSDNNDQVKQEMIELEKCEIIRGDVNEDIPLFYPVETKKMATVCVFYERAEESRLNTLINNKHIDSCLRKKLKTYMKHNRVHHNLFKVEYTYSKLAFNDSGRLFARESIGLQSFPREVRAYLAAHFLDDIDQINSLPTILSQLLKQHHSSCPEIDEYVLNRASALKRERLVKQDVIVALNNKAPPRNPFLAKIHSCIYNALVPLLQNTTGYWGTFWTHVKNIKHKDHKRNLEGTFFALVTQTIENQCIQQMINFLQEKGCVINSLEFDGVKIAKPKLFESHTILEECCAYVKEKT